MKTFVVLAALAASAGAAHATILSQWTIPTAFPTGAGNVPTGTFYSVGAADMGLLTAGTQLSTTHALPAATYTSPSGNGSQYAFSGNNWGIGDYYEARAVTTGYDTITISWDQTRSATGPVTFDLIVSTDGGGTFSTLVNDYTVLQSGGGGAPGTWTTGTNLPMYRTNGIAAGAGAANSGLVIFRFVAQVAGTATGGTGRVDNVTIEGLVVPTPGAFALVGLGGLAMLRRKR